MEIIRKDEEGIVFYTVVITGQSGMSQNGLARLAGVDPKTLRTLEDALRTSAPSKSLEPFVGNELTLRIDAPTVDRKPAGNLSIYKSSYCAAVKRRLSSAAQDIVDFAKSCGLDFSAIASINLAKVAR